MAEARASIGVIGGSGLYQMPGLTDVDEVALDTPFGAPSDVYTLGTLAGQRVAFLPRHGRGHRLSPSEIPARANIHGFKQLGVTHLLSVSAVGSLREEIRPLDLLVPDQIVDHTLGRPRSFFGDGLVVHVGLADPYCPELSAALATAAEMTGGCVHRGGAYICIEGPRFSTRAESRVYRQWGMDVIGMTAMPEAALTREAEICYATLALVTDYDVWHESEAHVSVEMVVANLNRNVDAARAAVRAVAPAVANLNRACGCGEALASGIITARERVTPEVRQRLELLIGRYL